jgi:excisionase family DNA binding protein
MALDFPAPADRPSYYTPKEFAALFGFSASWCHRHIREGHIKFVALGRRKFIPSDQVEAVMKARTKPW